jgi:hypothetical protein
MTEEKTQSRCSTLGGKVINKREWPRGMVTFPFKIRLWRALLPLSNCSLRFEFFKIAGHHEPSFPQKSKS